MEIKVSIIVPVYNVEQYLRKCLDSLIHQTLREIEIIIVNDCSPDGSQAIIDEYVQKDGRVKIIVHQENLGLGGARNTGIDAAKGKYIAFVDSDDWVELNAYEYLYTLAEKEQVDVIAFSFRSCTEDNTVLSYSHHLLENKWTNTKEILQAHFNYQIKTSVCMKLYKTELFNKNHIYFPVHRLYEDLATTIHILAHTQKILQIDQPFYFYRTNTSSITRTLSLRHIEDYVFAFSQIKQTIDRAGLDLKTELLDFFIIHSAYCYDRIYLYGAEQTDYFLEKYYEALGKYSVLAMHKRFVQAKNDLEYYKYQSQHLDLESLLKKTYHYFRRYGMYQTFKRIYQHFKSKKI